MDTDSSNTKITSNDGKKITTELEQQVAKQIVVKPVNKVNSFKTLVIMSALATSTLLSSVFASDRSDANKVAGAAAVVAAITGIAGNTDTAKAMAAGTVGAYAGGRVGNGNGATAMAVVGGLLGYTYTKNELDNQKVQAQQVSQRQQGYNQWYPSNNEEELMRRQYAEQQQLAAAQRQQTYNLQQQQLADAQRQQAYNLQQQQLAAQRQQAYNLQQQQLADAQRQQVYNQGYPSYEQQLSNRINQQRVNHQINQPIPSASPTVLTEANNEVMYQVKSANGNFVNVSMSNSPSLLQFRGIAPATKSIDLMYISDKEILNESLVNLNNSYNNLLANYSNYDSLVNNHVGSNSNIASSFNGNNTSRFDQLSQVKKSLMEATNDYGMKKGMFLRNLDNAATEGFDVSSYSNSLTMLQTPQAINVAVDGKYSYPIVNSTTVKFTK